MQRNVSLCSCLSILLISFVLFLTASCGGADAEISQQLILSATPTSTQPVPPSATPLPTPTQTPTPVPSLRSEAGKLGFFVGTSIDPSWFGERTFADFVAREYNMLTPEVVMKWDIIHPERDLYDFSRGDKVVDYARRTGMIVRGHTLVWDMQLPDWVVDGEKEGRYTREEWMDILRGHVMTVAGRYSGQIYAWDVVNEAVDEDGKLRDTIWLRTIGPDYISMAFWWAHEADPYALLFYNDNAGEGLNAKSDGIYKLVEELKEQGVPIRGVGMQMHTALNVSPSEQDLAANIKRLSDLGLKVHITEMDVQTQYSKKSDDEKMAAQAEVYRYVFQTCLEAPACEAFVVWGASDRNSWIPGYTGVPDMPLLFDEDYQPKPAYDAIMDVLQEFVAP